MPIAPLRPESDLLEKLSIRLGAMGGLVEHQLSNAIQAVECRDVELAQQVIDSDGEVDRRQLEIEASVLELLETRKLGGRNLRQAVMAMKVAHTLERVGDLAKNVAKRSLVTSRGDAQMTVASVARLGRIALRQIHDVLNAFQDRNPDIAVAVWGGDDELDELYNSVFQDILAAMMEDPNQVNAGTHLVFIAKNFERVGDHATNIAEAIHFQVTGAPLVETRPKGDETSTIVVPPPKRSGAL